MSEALSRTELLLGRDAVGRLSRARVAVFGLGGVGGHAAEALARAGIGALELIDHDTVAESNLNRQIFATRATIGMRKTDAAAQRLHTIRPELEIVCHPVFFLHETALDFSRFDYVLDAIDTVSGKLEIITRAMAAGVDVLSVMGAGNKLDPTRFRLMDLADTSGCPLARVMRRELRRRGIEHVRVVCSDEPPRPPAEPSGDRPGRPVPGSISFVPSAAGLIAAGAIVRRLAGLEE